MVAEAMLTGCGGYVLSGKNIATLRPILRSLWDRIGLSSGPSVAIGYLLYVAELQKIHNDVCLA